ncbi:MAG: glycosyltransferase [Planctomycetes bacterium]|nr:glycosyltransferase [Planctomycetota bacterium]
MSARHEVELSLVIPIYNAATFIEANLDAALRFLDEYAPSSELVLVDDCSTDDTLKVLERFRAKAATPRVRVLHNEFNRGKGFSVRRGMLEARGRLRVFNDADFTYPVDNVMRIVRALRAGADVAIACRLHPDSHYIVNSQFLWKLLSRHWTGRVFNFVARVLLVGELRDTQAGLKGFTADAAETIFPLQRMDRFSFDVETLFLALRRGMKVTEVGVQFIYRKEPSTIHFFGDTLKMLRDMFHIRGRAARGEYDRDLGSRETKASDRGSNEVHAVQTERAE